jgi:hypothetical protein
MRWKDSPEFKRAAYFTTLKRAGPVASAFTDFVFDRQKMKQNEDAEARMALSDPKRVAEKDTAEARWEAEKVAMKKGNGAAGVEKPVEPRPSKPSKH